MKLKSKKTKQAENSLIFVQKNENFLFLKNMNDYFLNFKPRIL